MTRVPVYYLPPSAARRFRGMGAVEGALWPTTGDLDVETESLARTISQFGHDVGSSPTPNNADYFQFERAWNAFVDDFNQWKDAAWFWNPTRRDQLLEYRARFNRLLEQSRLLNVATSAIAQASQPEPDSVDKLLSVVNKVVIVGVVGVVAVVGYKVWKETQ